MYICSQIWFGQERNRVNRLKVVLVKEVMTIKQLSEILNNPASISKWVTNAALPNVEMFIQLSKILGVKC